MFAFITNKFSSLMHNPSHNLHRIEHSLAQSLRLLQTLALNPNPNPTNPTIQHNPTVSYLITKCGLPLDSAISASKKLTITSTRKPDSVLSLFKSYDFSQPQIAKFISNCPRVLTANLNTNLKPKFEHFTALGLSKQDIVTHLFANEIVFLNYSLTNTIVPAVEFLKTILHTNENIVRAIKRWPYIIIHNFRIHLEPNVSTLRDKGVPELNISKLLMGKPRAFLAKNEVFRDSVKRVEEMGFRPHSLAYLRAIHVLLTTSQALWEKKVEVYKSFGWSDDDIMVAFKKQSMFMSCSEKKIRVLMGFYLNKLGLKVSDVVNSPNLLLLSLEKRVMPRCLVLHVLLSKGLIRNLNIISALITIKETFDKAYVTKYLDDVPEIASAYEGEKGLSESELTQLATMIQASNMSISKRITDETLSERKVGGLDSESVMS